MMKPVTVCIPAYSKELAAARRAGKVPARYEVIVALDVWAWGKPQGAMARCLVGPDRVIDEIDFGFLAGLDVLVAWSSAVTAGSRMMELARALLAIQPRRLLLLDMNPDTAHPVQWLKSVSHGVEIQL